MKRILRMKTGEEYTIIKEDGKYYICEDTQFRKSNSGIIEVVKVEEEKKEELKKKKSTAKKKEAVEEKGE